MNTSLSPEARYSLLHETISQPNKMAIVHSLVARGAAVEYRFSGRLLAGRMQVRIDGGPWQSVKSYERDVAPFLEGVE